MAGKYPPRSNSDQRTMLWVLFGEATDGECDLLDAGFCSSLILNRTYREAPGR